MGEVRRPAVAGMFYPDQRQDCLRQVQACLAAVPPWTGPVPKAIIAPHAGWVYSGPIAAAAYARLAPARGRITRVVLVGPSHRVAFRGLALSQAESWQTPLGEIPLDRETCVRLATLPQVGWLDAAHAQEHSLEVHLPFLQTVLGDFQLVPVVAGEASPDEVAALLQAAWGGAETAIVISSDLSHFLDYDAACALDGRTRQAIEALDPGAIAWEQACGRVPIGGLLVQAKRRGLVVETVDVRNSGDTAGDRSRVVGYGAWAFTEAPSASVARTQGAALLELARASIRHGLDAGAPLVPPADGPAALKQPGAAFVTLRRQGQLRGCIGSAQAWRALDADVAENAYKAAFADPRFPPLTPEEWEGVEIKLSVLTPPQPMSFADQDDLLAQLRPGTDGLIIEDAGRRALFLPSVWEQLPDKAAFLAHLKHKAGLPVAHWSPDFKAWRFQADEV